MNLLQDLFNNFLIYIFTKFFENIFACEKIIWKRSWLFDHEKAQRTESWLASNKRSSESSTTFLLTPTDHRSKRGMPNTVCSIPFTLQERFLDLVMARLEYFYRRFILWKTNDWVGRSIVLLLAVNTWSKSSKRTAVWEFHSINRDIYV